MNFTTNFITDTIIIYLYLSTIKTVWCRRFVLWINIGRYAYVSDVGPIKNTIKSYS